MQDPELKRLVDAMDSAAEWAARKDVPDLYGDIEVARLRLQVISRRLGKAVAASPYLAFIERIAAQGHVGSRGAVAAGA